jgi:hypothetical protein
MTASVKPQTVMRLYLAAFVVLAMLTACSSVIAPNGRQRIFNVSYETVTNELWALTPNPAALMAAPADTNTPTTNTVNRLAGAPVYVYRVTNDSIAPENTNAMNPLLQALVSNRHSVPIPFYGHELVAGQTYEFELPEATPETIDSMGTWILVTRIDSKSTRVQIKTSHAGLFFNTRNGKLERQRLNELSALLAKKS